MLKGKFLLFLMILTIQRKHYNK